MEKRWLRKPQNDIKTTEILENSLGVNYIVANLLATRGVTTYDQAKDFFRPNTDLLHDPFLMKGMDLAISRIEKARDRQESIMIYGDYDVDGTTSVALVYNFLKPYFNNISFYIPDRYTEGYGVSYKGIDVAHEQGTTLIIALDCGIKENDKIAYASSKGIDFIVCDHHLPGANVPSAVAVLDPKQKDCQYPFDELSGCGIGFKLIQAYCLKNELPDDFAFSYLDLVAVSIASDIVPLVGENRTLCFLGLKKLNENPCCGLQSIVSQLDKKGKKLNITDLMFQIGPRINAAGRIKHGSEAVKLLTSESEDESK